MGELWLAVAVALFFSSVSLKGLVPLAERIHLMDVPGGRKEHLRPTPLIGGLAAYCGVLAATLLVHPLSSTSLHFLIGGTIVLLVGMADDCKPLGVRLRLVFQILAIAFVCYGADLYISALPIPIIGGELKLGPLALPFTVFAVVGLMNAFNLADGIDGLSGCLSLVAILGIFSFASLHTLSADHSLVLLLAVSLIPYLSHNLGLFGHKVFLGDAGSMFVGFILAWSLIAQVESEPSSISSSSVLWCVAIPVIDTFGVMARRIRKGISPFKPDRDHLHHILQRAGLSSRQSLLLIVAASLAILGFGLVIETVLPNYAVVAFFGLFLIYNYSLKHAWKVQKYLKG